MKMFEISKIRMRRLKNLIVYGLAVYGAITLLRGCGNEAQSYEIQDRPYAAGRIEYAVNQQSREAAAIPEPSLLELRADGMCMR